MRYVDREQVSCDPKIVDLFEDPLGAAQDALTEAERALASVMLEMAEAGCKGAPKPERRLRALQLAYHDALENLHDLRARLQSESPRRAGRPGVKSIRDPM